MPRERSPAREKAKEMYLNSKGEMKLKDIAEQLGVLDTQIRKWKSTDKWDNELKGTLPKGKGNVPNKKEHNVKEESLQKAVTELENSELTDKQRLFCIYYIKCFNATKAAEKAGYSKDTAGVIGYQLLQKTLVKDEIQKLKLNKLNRAMLGEDDIFQKYIDIAFADISDYVEFGQEEVPVMGPFGPITVKDENDKEKELTKIVNVIKFKESIEVDGTIISEVKQGRDGASIKLLDKMKALDWLAKHMDLLDTATKEKLKIENEKVSIAKEKLEIDKQQANINNIDTELKIIVDYGDEDDGS